MSSAMIGMQRFDMGRVVGRTFEAIGANAATLLLSALLFVGLPQALWSYVSSLGAGGDYLWIGLSAILGGVVMMVGGIVLQGVVTHTVIADLLGRKATMGESVEVALRSFWMLFAVGFVSGLGIAVGAVFLIVPGVFLMLMWLVVGPVIVAERTDFSDTFSRSARLTENHRWILLGLCVIYIIGVVVVSVPIDMALRMIGGPVSAMINAVVQSVVSLVGAAGVAAIYVELRTVKEGTGRESIASVFE